jgi:hypothetical protein
MNKYINFIETTFLYYKLEHPHYILLHVLGQPVCQAVHLLHVGDFVDGLEYLHFNHPEI